MRHLPSALDLLPHALSRRSALGLATALPVASLLGLAACAPLQALNALTPRGAREVTHGIAYGPLPRQRLDVYRPRAEAPATGWPVVVFFYGGTWTRGARADYAFVGEALAAQGLLSLVADYRLYPEVRYPDFLNDCAAALAHALRQAQRLGGDPQRVVVMGHSAGAYNAAMLALDPRWLGAQGLSPGALAAWVGLAGPYDFLPIDVEDAKPVFMHPNYPAGSQPIAYAGPHAPPSFLAAAQHDDLVNPERNTRQLAERLRQAGVPVTLKRYTRVDHATLIGAFAAPLRFLAPVLEDVAAFIHAAPRIPGRAA